MRVWWLAVPLGCAAPSSPGPEFVVRHARLPGGEPVALRIAGGKIAAVAEDLAPGALPVVDLEGRFLAPAFVDSHVHLVYAGEDRAVADGGIAAVVDLAAPLDRLAPPPDGPRWLFSGPMITAPGGYPTRSWGAGGYGLEVATVAEAEAAVDRVIDAGASVVKVPFDGGPSLTDDQVRAVVARAHARKRPVVAHALGDADAARAAALGVDGLAHTPVEPLKPSTVAAWSGRFVVSTLAAFGGSADAVANLRKLREAGAVVLYGTDLGNTRTVGVDPAELALLGKAGLDGRAVLAAATSAPAERWGLSDLGALEPGRAASFLVLDADPAKVPATLADPVEVWLDGVRR